MVREAFWLGKSERMEIETRPPPLPSERSFGLFFGAVLGLVAAWGWFRGGAHWPALTALAGVALAIAGLGKPTLLAVPNRWWFRFGLLLHRVVSPLVLGLIYFGLFTPVALGMRLFKRDALHRKFEPGKSSYWVDRAPPGPDAESFTRQF